LKITIRNNKYKNIDSHLYIAVKNNEQPKGWFKIRQKYTKGILRKYKTQEFDAFHSATLLKLYQAQLILNVHIIPLFKHNPAFYFTEKSKHMHSKELYSKHVINRYLYLGAFFWSLCGALDNLANEICVAMRCSKRKMHYKQLATIKLKRFDRIIKIINEKKTTAVMDQIHDFRNLLSHNAQFLHVVGWKYDKNDRHKNFLPKLTGTYLVGKKLEKLTSLFAQARQNKDKRAYLKIRRRYCYSKSTIETCHGYYLETKKLIARIYNKI